MKKYLLSLVLMIPLSVFVAAQDDDSEDVEEVVVTGIKKSLISAIDIKRSNVGVVDAITAEDFGKFPDNNLAESLARVVGIGIDRSNVEGERVAVRGFGPELNLVTLNGRQMPTVPGQYGGGRAFNFGDISSHGVAAVEVYKSTNSTLPSGGIGSTINMVTTKPLSINGSLNSFSFDMLDDSTSNDGLKPEFNFVHSSNFGKFGFAVSGSFQDRNNIEEGTRESNWLSVEDMAAIEGYSRVDKTASGITDNNQRADGKTFYQEPTAYQIKENDRERTNAQVTMQYAFSDTLMATVDYTYSQVEFSSVGQMFGSWLGGWTTSQGTINKNGVYTDVVVGDRGYDHQLIWGDTENENASVGINLEWDYSDTLSFVFDYHDSSAEKTGTELPNELGFVAPATATLSHYNGGTSGINSFAYDTKFDADDYTYGSLYFRDAYKENQMEQMQFKGKWENLDGAVSESIKSVEFGISRADSEFNDIRMEQINNATPGTSASSSIFTETSLNNFMTGFSTELYTSYYFDIDKVAAIEEWTSNFGAITAGPIDINDKVEETLDSAFVQVNMEFVVNDRPLNVVAGIRYEESDTTSTALESTPSVVRWDFINGLIYPNGGEVPAARSGSNDIVLPQLAMSYELSDDQVLRFSYGKSMGRPNLQDLRSSFQFGNRDYLIPTASGGNPNLKSLESENIDLAYEYYYDEGSYFSINYFKKDIDNFISSDVSMGTINTLTNPANGEIGAFAQACIQEWDSAGRPDTVSYGEPGSWEYCASQQAIWAQSWMNLYQHMGWVALAMQAHGGTLPETWNNGWAFDYGGGSPNCNDGGWWRCNPGYIDGTSSDPLAIFEITRPLNLESGSVDGFEVVLQHLFGDSGFGTQINATFVSGGDVDIDRYDTSRQFILPGLGDSSNFSLFYEDSKVTARIALNTRGETVAGFGNYDQPLYVEERKQWDLSMAYNVNEDAVVFFEVQNLNDEPTRLYARYQEMLFLSQDHGPIHRLGFRYKF